MLVYANMFACVCAYICICVGVCAHVHVCGSQSTLDAVPQQCLSPFEIGCLSELGGHQLGEASYLVSTSHLLVSSFQGRDYKCAALLVQLLCGFLALNSSLHVFKALLTDLSPDPLLRGAG